MKEFLKTGLISDYLKYKRIKEMESKNEGIILGSIEYKEASKIVYIYTKDGRKSVIAKNSRKYESGLQAFSSSLSKVSYTDNGHSFPTLIDYYPINSFKNIKDNFTLLSYANSILEIINQLPSNDYQNKIYDFLNYTLLGIEESNKPLIYYEMFLVKMLKILGILPELNHCVKCNSDEELFYFSVSNGGALCKNCGSGNKYLDDIKKLYYFNISNSINDLVIDNSKEILENIFEYYLKYSGLSLKSFKLIKIN